MTLRSSGSQSQSRKRHHATVESADGDSSEPRPAPEQPLGGRTTRNKGAVVSARNPTPAKAARTVAFASSKPTAADQGQDEYHNDYHSEQIFHDAWNEYDSDYYRGGVGNEDTTVPEYGRSIPVDSGRWYASGSRREELIAGPGQAGFPYGGGPSQDDQDDREAWEEDYEGEGEGEEGEEVDEDEGEETPFDEEHLFSDLEYDDDEDEEEDDQGKGRGQDVGKGDGEGEKTGAGIFSKFWKNFL